MSRRASGALRALVVCGVLTIGVSPALADALPEPGRPEWQHTPLPMPEPPPTSTTSFGVAIVSALLALGLASALRSRERR